MGLLDIIGELAKILSLSARLFGNIFAGDVMILVIVSLSTYTQFFVPLPFLALSIFSGFVQAFVFSLLSIQFLSGTITSVKGKGHPVPAEGASG
ncbi:MAG: F-type H+-transporting ATPase subunit a [Patescibacteria group bacterium]|nr:F-type H+-transporting ATPase subunit a [Patescibacteria group bacterium]